MLPRTPRRLAALLALHLLALTTVAGRSQSQRTEAYYRAAALVENGHPRAGAQLLDSLLRAKPHALYALASAKAWLRARQPDSARQRLASHTLRRENERWLAYACLECQLGNAQRGLDHLAHYLKARRKQDELRIASDTLLRPCMDHPGWDSLWLDAHYSRRAKTEAELHYHATHGDWGVMEDLLDGLTPRQQERAGYAYYRALALRGKGETESALAAAQTAYGKYPERLDVLLLYADLLLTNDKPSRALRALQRYQKTDPHNPHLLPLLARAKAQRELAHEAYQHSRAYMAYYPTGPGGELENVHLHIRLCIATGHWAQGLETIARVMPLATIRDKRRLHRARAEILEALGEHKQAEIDYATARSL